VLGRPDFLVRMLLACFSVSYTSSVFLLKFRFAGSQMYHIVPQALHQA
jgi:hypothetical protein